jgi:dCTP deaminase
MAFRDEIEDSLVLGVLNLKRILQLIDEGVVIGADKTELMRKIGAEENESAIDLRLSELAWELGSTLKPRSNTESESVSYLVNKYGKKFKVSDTKTLLEKGKVYVFRLQESLNLKDKFRLSAQASGKSSIGRLDILTRLIVDDSPVYDVIKPPHRGDLYVEVIPLSFPIHVKIGDSVNQLRLFRGRPKESRLTPKLLLDMETPIILDHTGENKSASPNQLSIDLSITRCGSEHACAFVAKKCDKIDPIEISVSGRYTPEDYWERVSPQGDALQMEQDRFYILRSKERFYLPDNIAVRCVAYTENLGETRIHYAGFAHPWFSRSDRTDRKRGAPLIFEVRCHSFPVLARDGEDFARIEFYRMSDPTRVKNKNYDSQELKLSKCFDEWK